MAFFESEASSVTIDLEAIRDNIRFLLSSVSKGCRLMPVVKSDAYGHGIVEVASMLEEERIWGFGIYEMDEAAILRRAGVHKPIFLLSGLLGDDAEKVIEFDLTVGCVSIQELTQVNEAARAHGKKAQVHVKVDTGMSRFGMSPEEICWIVENLDKFQNLTVCGLYSHLACADEPDSPTNHKQLVAFKELVRRVHDMGWRPKFIHMANSAAIFSLKDSLFTMARPGIAVYGALKLPHGLALDTKLQQAMTFKSKIIHMRTLPRGAGVSYGHTFVMEKDSKIALVPVGYDNGYLRTLSNRAHVLINGIRCPVVGNVCMKTIMVDVGNVKGCKPGDEVVLMGRQGAETIGAIELAQRASTISYEILCLLGKLNRRKFIG
ncbi:MAG: alanine racemase [Thermodesulfobacteria bacterium]|nr:alanine racemase [Thermodesulfobacteriota bacterium]